MRMKVVMEMMLVMMSLTEMCNSIMMMMSLTVKSLVLHN